MAHEQSDLGDKVYRLMQTSSGRGMAWLRSRWWMAAGGLYLVFLWSRNYNLLGDAYDYSIVTSACAHLHAGLTPYRDFTTPLQSLTLYLCLAMEWVFGQNYLALAYGNLAFGLAFYAAILCCLGSRFPVFLRVLIAVALCGSTFFQHGILWYNSLGMLLLTLTVWCAALWYEAGGIQWRHLSALGVLLYFSSMCKLNFHAVGLGITFSILFLLLVKVSKEDRRKFVWIVPALLLAGLALGPATEIILSHTTWRDFLENVVLTPQSRVRALPQLLNPRLYTGNICNYFPDDWISGIYLKALVVLAGCLWWVVRKSRAHGRETRGAPGILPGKWLVPVLLAGFYLCSLLLTVSNFEAEIVTSVFLVAGAVAVCIMCASLLPEAQISAMQAGVGILSGLFVLTGGASAMAHSRLRYGEPSAVKIMLETLRREKSLTALEHCVPFYPAGEISARFEPYFHGVRFTEPGRDRMAQIVAFLDEHRLNERMESVYWGPGLEILNEVYGHPPRVRLPLWYHRQVTVRDSDAPRLIGAFKQADYEWIITTRWKQEMPAEVMGYIKANYDEQAGDGVYFFHRKARTPAAAASWTSWQNP